MTEFSGRVALVTGAGSGVGRATSLMLARAGAFVGLMGRSQTSLESVATEIRELTGQEDERSLVLPADIADERAVDASTARLVQTAGGLDYLIASAGVGIYGPVEGYRLADWERTFSTNVTGLFLCARAALPHLRARSGGQIIAISSGAGRQGYANRAAYSASKFAVIGFMESLAAEVGPLGIKCTTIVPGSILTDFGPDTAEEKQASDKKFLLPEDVAGAIVQVLRQPGHAFTQEINLWPF